MVGTVAIEPDDPVRVKEIRPALWWRSRAFSRRNSVPACSMCEFGTKCGQIASEGRRLELQCSRLTQIRKQPTRFGERPLFLDVSLGQGLKFRMHICRFVL